MNLLSDAFWGVSQPAFKNAVRTAFNSVKTRDGIYVGDNLFTINRNLSFLQNEAFMKAYRLHATTDIEQSIAWRLAVVAWAAKSVISRKVPGDFVECACYKGTTARIVCDYVDFGHTDRHYYLYDLFEHDSGMLHHSMPEHSARLYAQVKERFSEFNNVTITQGRVPEVLNECSPETVAFLHIDLNNAPAEIGALEHLFHRLSPGGILVLDDYGWMAYRAQKAAEDPWLAQRGYEVLELPTGQGLVFK